MDFVHNLLFPWETSDVCFFEMFSRGTFLPRSSAFLEVLLVIVKQIIEICLTTC